MTAAFDGQESKRRRPDGTEQVSIWYEAQRGFRLRIDHGDPTLGNGALYTADSLHVVRDGAGGWRATRVHVLDRRVPARTEEYSDWKSVVALAVDV